MEERIITWNQVMQALKKMNEKGELPDRMFRGILQKLATEEELNCSREDNLS